MPPSNPILRLNHWLITPAPGLDLSDDDAELFPVYAYCSLLGLVAHCSYVPLFLWLGVLPLAKFNVLSVLTFVFATTLARRGRLLPSLLLMIVEVLAHAVVGSVLLGWDGGLHYPILILVPVLFLTGGLSLRTQALGGVALLLVYSAAFALTPATTGALPDTSLYALAHLNIVVAFSGLVGTSAFHGFASRQSRIAYATEYERAEHLLLNILPGSIAERLKSSPSTIADAFPECSVLFADIVGFTPLSSKVTPTELVALLNQIFSAFDELTDELGLEKIKTIGDSYMAAAGLPDATPEHAVRVAEMALRIIAHIEGLGAIHGEQITVRIGVNSGPVVAGVIGQRRFIYDLWGDTVNIAARMESHGVPGAIQVSDATYQLLQDRYRFEERGLVDVKGKGSMRTWMLIGRI